MSNHRQLIHEIEIKYPHEGSKNGEGIETFYFYNDREYEIESFKRFALNKAIAKNHGRVTYDGKARSQTISRFKRDPMKMHCVSSYVDTDMRYNPLINGKFS